jgi:hypothetical protein
MNLECLWFRAGFVWCVYSWFVHRTDMNSVYNYKWVLLFIDVSEIIRFLSFSMLGSTSTIFDISVGELDVAFERVFGYCVYLITIMCSSVIRRRSWVHLGQRIHTTFMFHSVFLFSLFSSKSWSLKLSWTIGNATTIIFCFIPRL